MTLSKAATGIEGLDEIMTGGVPRGRATLVCGGPGCGKTVLGMSFLVHGARALDEPGLFVSFEETPQDLADNYRGFGVDVDELREEGRLRISHVVLARDEVFTSGEFSLDGLLIRLKHGIEQVNAKRVVLDSPEGLFSYLGGDLALRGHLSRLFHFLRESGVTSVVTAERGRDELTRHGLEEFLSDCVLLLDHRVSGNVAKRRLRIVKYRGSAHGPDEYPFLIDGSGIAVIPITSVSLDDTASSERVSTGVADLDEMLEGEGYFLGSRVLVTGMAGTGKSTLAAAFARATCARGKRCLYLAFEESQGQITRNMASVGIDLRPWLDDESLKIRAFKPTLHGLEEHLVAILQMVDAFGPDAVVVDPISNFISIGDRGEVKSMLTRVMAHLEERSITTLLTSLTPQSHRMAETNARVSSLMDTWISIRYRFEDDERSRWLQVVKSRGMRHSGQTREMLFSSTGIQLRSRAERPDGTSP
jgi:circadian clock protein KaiC